MGSRMAHRHQHLCLHQPHRYGRGSGKVGRESGQADRAAYLPNHRGDQQPLLYRSDGTQRRRQCKDHPHVYHQGQPDPHGYPVRHGFSQCQRRFQAALGDHQGQRIPRRISGYAEQVQECHQRYRIPEMAVSVQSGSDPAAA